MISMGCASLVYPYRVTEGTILDARVLASSTRVEQVETRRWEVVEADILKTRLVGRLRHVARCQSIITDEMLVTQERAKIFVNNDGESGAVGTWVAVEAVLALTAPLVVPVLIADSGSAGGSENVDFGSDEALAMAGAIGGIMAMAALVDGLHLMFHNGTRRWTEMTRVRRPLDASFPCDPEEVPKQPVWLRIGASELAGELGVGGRFEVELGSLIRVSDIPTDWWFVALAGTAWMPVPMDPPSVHRLVERLSAASRRPAPAE